MKRLATLALCICLAGCTTTETTFPDGKHVKTVSASGFLAAVVSGFTQGAAAVFEARSTKGFSK